MQRMNQPISITRSSDFRTSNDQIINEEKTYDLAHLRQKISLADGYYKRLYMPLGVDSLDQALAGADAWAGTSFNRCDAGSWGGKRLCYGAS